MTPRSMIAATDVGMARIEIPAPDRFVVEIDDALCSASGPHCSVTATLFMPQPGRFVDFDPDGYDTVSILPRGAGPVFADAAQAAADIEAGLPIEDGAGLSKVDAGKLRLAVLMTAERAFKAKSDLDQDLGDDPKIDDVTTFRM